MSGLGWVSYDLPSRAVTEEAYVARMMGGDTRRFGRAGEDLRANFRVSEVSMGRGNGT